MKKSEMVLQNFKSRDGTPQLRQQPYKILKFKLFYNMRYDLFKIEHPHTQKNTIFSWGLVGNPIFWFQLGKIDLIFFLRSLGDRNAIPHVKRGGIFFDFARCAHGVTLPSCHTLLLAESDSYRKKTVLWKMGLTPYIAGFQDGIFVKMTYFKIFKIWIFFLILQIAVVVHKNNKTLLPRAPKPFSDILGSF